MGFQIDAKWPLVLDSRLRLIAVIGRVYLPASSSLKAHLGRYKNLLKICLIFSDKNSQYFESKFLVILIDLEFTLFGILVIFSLKFSAFSDTLKNDA